MEADLLEWSGLLMTAIALGFGAGFLFGVFKKLGSQV